MLPTAAVTDLRRSIEVYSNTIGVRRWRNAWSSVPSLSSAHLLQLDSDLVDFPTELVVALLVVVGHVGFTVEANIRAFIG